MASTKIVQARLDEKTVRLLARLRRQTGLSDSDLVRRGLELVSTMQAPAKRQRIKGIGVVASGISDLATNPRHMDGFGRS